MPYKAKTYVRLFATAELSGETSEDVERQAKEFQARVISGEVPTKLYDVELSFEGTQEEYVVSDYWTCRQSPINRCEYDPDDSAHDDCVHCGEPEERK